MNLLGLHPTSVEFFQRVGYQRGVSPHDLDSFMEDASYANELASLLDVDARDGATGTCVETSA